MNKTAFIISCLCLPYILLAQPNYTANDQVTPYNGHFRPSVNLGEYTSFSEEALADLAAGNPALGVRGVGAKALRPGLFEEFVASEGYDSKLAEYEHFFQLGLRENTLIVGFPSEAHRDQEEYCDGKRSELFSNMYEPIWDGGANGTPVNEDNYYALYLWNLVNHYGEYVRFWEIWNEPGFDYTGGLGWLPPGADGNWWENNPDPCDYKLRAPIFHYVRLLRISWEIVKTLEPEDYIVVSGTGFPAFVDAILRNTDNPEDGSVTSDYPLKGGAYFDVKGYHAYPHFDGSLKVWDDDLTDFVYSRHSDAAADGLMLTRDTFQGVLDSYGYDGITYPKKLWMITEVNLPRKEFQDFIGSAEAQRNFMIKSVVKCMQNDFLQMHVYKLGEDNSFENAQMEFELMGLYKELDYNNLYFQDVNEEGIALKTVSDLLFGKNYDPIQTANLSLPQNVGGGAFQDEFGNYTYVLWAKTTEDFSELAQASYSFPSNFEINTLIKRNWNNSYLPASEEISSDNIELTAAPIFLTDRIFEMNLSSSCVPGQAHLVAQPPVPNSEVESLLWTITGGTPITSTLWEPQLNLFVSGTYEVTLEIWTTNGSHLQQTDIIQIDAAPESQFSIESSGPIVRFFNESSPDVDEFLWEFGDGVSSEVPSPTHVYFESGEFEVTLTVFNNCGEVTTSQTIEVQVPEITMLSETANDVVPPFTGHFKPSTYMEFYDGWDEETLADIVAGNIEKYVPGAGVKALRTVVGEALFNGLGYDFKKPVYQYYSNLDLRDNAFLLDFPSEESRDENFYCPDFQSILFKDLYLDIWDNGQNGTPVNDDNPFAVYVYNTVQTYKDHIQFWEVFHGPDFDFTGEWGWLPPGELGNWWENNPDPCQYSLRAPIFYYNRVLRIAYEIVKTYDPDAYVTVSGVAFLSFLDAVLRNTDNPLDGSVHEVYPLKGGAYFDAIGFKSYPHIDGSTIYFDVNQGTFAFERHSDGAVRGISKIKGEFEGLLKDYGYDGNTYPRKEWVLSEANLPRQQFGDFIGSAIAQRNWVIKAYVECIKNDIRRLNIHHLGEVGDMASASDPFELMGLYQNLNQTPPFTQVPNEEAVALKTTSLLLYGTTYDPARTAELALTDDIDGAAFQNADGNYIYVLWAKTQEDQTEFASATYSFPGGLGINTLFKKEWYYANSLSTSQISASNISLDGTPIFLTELESDLTPPLAHFNHSFASGCPGLTVEFTDQSAGNPTSWEWSFPGGTPASSTDPNPTVVYNSHGEFSVDLKVTNAAGEHTKTKTEIIEIAPLPVANFEFSIDNSEVTFNNLSEHGDGYYWDFGDNTFGLGLHPVHNYTFNGEYTVMLVTFNGCGTDTTYQQVSVEAIPGSNFSFNAPAHCDSLAVLFLDGSTGDPTSWEWTFEGGSPETSNSQFPTVLFADAGFHEVTLVTTNAFGSHELVQNVYVEGDIATSQNISLCEGDEYAGQIITQDTTIIENLSTSQLACDSISTTEITVVNVLESFINSEVCFGDDFEGNLIYSDTSYVKNLNSQNGCDSLVYVDIQVLEVFETILDVQVCESDQFPNDTLIVENLIAANGCDSIVQLNISVLENHEVYLQEAICKGDYYNGILIEEHTTIVEEFTTVEGCDSLVYVDITALDTYETHLLESINSGQSITIGDSTYTETGLYEIPLVAQNGCDSLIILDLTIIDNVDNVAFQNQYALKAFPNPFSELVTIQFELPNQAEISMEIYDVNGKVLEQLIDNELFNNGTFETLWESTNHPNGVYFGKLRVGEEIGVFRLVKL